jgi:MFS family permease
MSRVMLRIPDSLSFMRGNMLVFTVTRILGQFGRSMAFPYASLYILALGGEPAQIGLVNSLAPLAGLLVFPLGGYITDKAGRVRIIGIASFVSGVGYLMHVLAQRWEVIALSVFLHGFMVIQFPPQSALIADSLAPQDRGRGMALMDSLGSLPAMVAPYIAGLVITAFGVDPGMRYLYAFLVFAYTTAGIMDLRFLRETTKPDPNNGFRLRESWRIIREAYGGIPDTLRQLPRSIKALAVIIILCFVANAMVGPFWVVYAVTHLGLSTVEWGLILLIETVLRTIVAIPAGVMVDRYGRTRFVVLALVLALIGVPTFILARSFALILALRSVVAVSNAFFGPAASALLADTVPRAMRGRVMAALGRGAVWIGASGGGTGGPGLGFLIILPLFFASLGAGYLYDARPTAPWLVAGVAIVICLVLTLGFIRDPQNAEL